MNSFFRMKSIVLCLVFGIGLATGLQESAAQNPSSANLRFQRPGSGTSHAKVQKFRRPGTTEPQIVSTKKNTERASHKKTVVSNPLRTKKKNRTVAKKVKKPQASTQTKQVRSTPKKVVIVRDQNLQLASNSSPEFEQDLSNSFSLTGHDCPDCQESYPVMDPGYESYDACYDCGEPACGCPEPSCGIIEPGCGCADGTCGVPGCGSCVGRPGPDYWCFPICFPRFKDLSVWGGVQGFRGPRDFIPGGESNSNFGFHEGFNISGRAPLVGLLFPQLSYQLGYQAVQSRLHGTLTSVDDRSQQFVTAGLFRRVHTGLQFGAVWDMMDDDLDTNIDLQQIRAEISLKSPRGREIGFWSATSTNSSISGGVSYETVNQYAFFYRCNFGKSYQTRFWGGFSDDDEGLVGAEVYAPLSDRWSVRSNFNYLITDQENGPVGVQEESWNIGMSLVWHLGRNARRGCHSPFRPLFSVADNGWMFVDRQ